MVAAVILCMWIKGKIHNMKEHEHPYWNYVSAHHKGEPGGKEDKEVVSIGRKHGLKSDGSGTDLDSGNRDVGFPNVHHKKVDKFKEDLKKSGYKSSHHPQSKKY